MLMSSWLTSITQRLRNQRQASNRRTLNNRKTSGQHTEDLEIRSLLTSLVDVRPNIGDSIVRDEIRHVAPQELTLQFSLGSSVDVASIGGTNGAIRVTGLGADGAPGGGDDNPMNLGFVGIGDRPNEVVIRFAQNLPDDKYEISIANTLRFNGGTPFNGGVSSSFPFELDLGAQVLAIDPQPVTRNSAGQLVQARDKIVVHFNNDKLDPVKAQDPSFYQLIFTKDSVSNLDDVKFNPIAGGAVYDSNANTVTLTFENDLAALIPGAGAVSYRLRIGNAEAAPSAPTSHSIAVDPTGNFASPDTTLGVLGLTGASSKILSSTITGGTYSLTLPGATVGPGHRDLVSLFEDHLDVAADTVNGVTTFSYNFKSNYGSDPLGTPLINLITDAQKERAREVFEVFGTYFGVDFVETASSGLTIATGDMRAIAGGATPAAGGVRGFADRTSRLAVLDMAENWNNLPGGDWYLVAMHEIGRLLGLGYAYDLPTGTVMGSGFETGALPGSNIEPAYPGNHDIVHGQHLYRPDVTDIDLYEFEVRNNGAFSAEVVAERQMDASNLDSVLRLYRKNTNGTFELISQNDDYFSSDSFLTLNLTPGFYYLGISSKGNDAYDPSIADSGFGGTSQGKYDIRVDFRPDVNTTITDSTNTPFDGDHDGQPGGAYNFWFRTATAANTLFVDKSVVSTLRVAASSASTQIAVRNVQPFSVSQTIRINNEQMLITAINPSTRTLTVQRAQNGTTASAHASNSDVNPLLTNGLPASPFGFIRSALQAAGTGQIVRVVGNSGADGNINNLADNLPYQIGFDANNQPLEDGSTLEVPKGVTLMIDGGSVFKMRQSLIGVGSSSAAVDRSQNALQILGTPLSHVTFTSWNNEAKGTDTSPLPTQPQAGDWGGISFRNAVDKAQSRFSYENQGIFLNYVGFADIEYGGGTVTLDSVQQTVNSIMMERSQPTILHNTISKAADSAMSADPDSFEEITFNTAQYQDDNSPARFTTNYKRVGPEIYGNVLTGNSTNGLFIRVLTPAGSQTVKLTVPGRFDDTDIVHVIAQNLEIQGTPGGASTETVAPSVSLVTVSTAAGGTLDLTQSQHYRVVFVDSSGFESPDSATITFNPAGGPLTMGSIQLGQLPVATGNYSGRRIYRSLAGVNGTYVLAGEIDRSATTFTDTGLNLGRQLTSSTTRNRARLDARLAIDPGVVVKMQGSRIQVGTGAQLIAEGTEGHQVIVTSRLDDRYGAGGTFDTNNDGLAGASPAAGNWGGIYVGHVASASIDHALISFGGGTVPTGSSSAGFNVLEVHQAEVRVRNTVFDTNADGGIVANDDTRSGFYTHAAGTIFVRGAQPIVLDNIFRNNSGPVININVNALGHELLSDYGRSTGLIDAQSSYGTNQGPLIRDNSLGGNSINGMLVRGETIMTESVWDDTDMVHVVQSEIVIPNLHTYGGVRLESSPTESLVIKLQGGNAGFTSDGSPLDINDRIGGILNVVGQPGFPVVMTSLRDDTVGAGKDLKGNVQKDTNNNISTGAAGDWRGIDINEFSHDRNVKFGVEQESEDALIPDANANPAKAEVLGALAADQKSGDENLRLGFTVQGSIKTNSDVDVYSFSGSAGTQVWIDIDRTTYTLDTVVELLDSNGQILAQADNSMDIATQALHLYTAPGAGVQAFAMAYDPANGIDHYGTNRRDAGLRVVLPGTSGVRGNYFIRVRSSNIDSLAAGPNFADLRNPALVANGRTNGVYQLQLRLQETDEFAGNSIIYADMKFATNAIRVTGQPMHSPLAGEFEELEGNDALAAANPLGNLMSTDRAAIAVRGTIQNTADVDFYSFSVTQTATRTGASQIPVVFDIDYADGLTRANLTLAVYDSQGQLVLIGRDSNVTDDRKGPQSTSGIDDLSRGSVGTFDPFIGTVELAPGDYSLAVFNNTQIPSVLDQFSNPASANSTVRLYPLQSVNLGQGNLFNAASPTPFQLSDLRLFVSSGTGGTTVINTINPAAGTTRRDVGNFASQTGDIAMRDDGSLFTLTTGSLTAATSALTGNYLQINTETGASTNLGDDGIVTNFDDVVAGVVTPGNETVVVANAGIVFEAMAYRGIGATRQLFAIGTRANLPEPATARKVNAYDSNILYELNASTGAVVGNGADRTVVDPLEPQAYEGAGSTQRERGQVTGVNGTITGMAYSDDTTQLFVVTNTGFLYEVNQVTLLATPRASTGLAFAGLALGPQNAGGGDYANVLFAIDTDGEVRAFDFSGNNAAVFLTTTGALSNAIITGITNVRGLAFSSLDANPWTVATLPTGSTQLQFPNATTGNYNFPGGARGSIISDSFSLAGYSASDKPTLYFDYQIGTDGTDSDLFRVFIESSPGNWTPIAANKVSTPTVQLGTLLFNNTADVRQARIELDAFAGRSNLRLRYEFTTAGAANLGTNTAEGIELRAVPGSELRDGQSFTVRPAAGGATTTFEFEMGPTLVVPSGAGAIGSTFVRNGVTWTYATTAGANTIVVTAADTAADVAGKTIVAIGGSRPIGGTSNRVTLAGQNITSATGRLVIDGALGTSGGNVPVSITPIMSSAEVAAAMRAALATRFASGAPEAFPTTGDLIRVIGRVVNVANAPALRLTNSLAGDDALLFPGNTAGTGNTGRGIVIDNIVIGFAERGERVLNAAVNQSFIANPVSTTGQLTTGAYDLEIRRGSDLTVLNGLGFPIARTLDTNDREINGLSLTMASASEIPDGATLTLSDGVNDVTFQFIDQRGTTTPTPGFAVVTFDTQAGTTDNRGAVNSSSIATLLRNAINSAAVQGVLKIKASLSDGQDAGSSSTSNRLHLTGNAIIRLMSFAGLVSSQQRFNQYGDQNQVRDQGQLIIQSSIITNSSQFGIIVDAETRGAAYAGARPGSVRNLQEINTSRITTGVVIQNNVVATNGSGGIRFSGDAGTTPLGQVPYGRIINNTVVGSGAGVGIQVDESASPTLLNNIVADFATGISVDGSSQTAGTVIAASVYRGNTTDSNAGLGLFPIILTAANPLFVNQSNRNYYLAPGSPAIDSSLTSLSDRSALTTVKSPLGLGISPILAPEFDAYGQLRGDDPGVSTPSGQGATVFIDRGAIDRVDFFRPVAVLTGPEDQGTDDLEPLVNRVWIDGTAPIRELEVTLTDLGIGIDDTRVDRTGTQFMLFENSTGTERLLVSGVDYIFEYFELTNKVVFSASTVFSNDARYRIVIDNNDNASDGVFGIRDYADNYVEPNELDGTTQLHIMFTDAKNDAPVITAPLVATVDEDTLLTFTGSVLEISVADRDAFLGTNVLTMTFLTFDGTVSLSQTTGLTFLLGDGTDDDEMVFEGTIPDINAALAGMTFIGSPDFFGNAFILVSAEDQGQFTATSSDPATDPMQDVEVIAIGVLPVNDQPVFSLTLPVPTRTEDAGPQAISAFMTGQSGGPANEPQAVTTHLTVTSIVSPTGGVSPWDVNNFFAPGGAPTVDPVTGRLTYTVAPDVNGTATISMVVRDTELLDSDPIVFTIVVTPINDRPEFSLTLPAPTITEDAGSQSVTAFMPTKAGGPVTALDEPQTLTTHLTVTSIVSPTGGVSPWNVNNFFAPGGAPTVDPVTGRLTYTVAQDVNGTAAISMVVRDSAGLDSLPQTFNIVVSAVNDRPLFTLALPLSTITEDAGAQSVNLFMPTKAGGPATALDEPQTLTTHLTVTSIVSPTGGVSPWNIGNFFVAGEEPKVDAVTGQLTYRVAQDVNGTAAISMVVRDSAGRDSLPQTFNIVVSAVNDRPLFTLALPLSTITEDAGSQSVTAFMPTKAGGPATALDEPQTLTTHLTVTSIVSPTGGASPWNIGNFFAPGGAPTVDPVTGRLTYTVAQDVNGTASISMVVRDSAGLDSLPQTFNIVVSAVNDRPLFTLALPLSTITEDAGAQSVNSFMPTKAGGPATAIDEPQTLTTHLTVTSIVSPTGGVSPWNISNFFVAGEEPKVDAVTGQLTYRVAPDVNGTATISMVVRDSAGLDSLPQTFNIVASAVNDIPEFTLTLPVPNVIEDAGAQSVTSFMPTKAGGPATALDEPQTLTTHLTVTSIVSPTGGVSPWNIGNFFAPGGAPTVDPVTGRLTYTVAQDVNGTASISMVVRDSAGRDSLPQTFTIAVSSINDEPVFSINASVVPITVPEDTGPRTVDLISLMESARGTALDEVGLQTPFNWILGPRTTTSGNLAFDNFEILPTGQLRFQTRANTAGTARFTLQLLDSGSSTAPNDNASQIVELEINVTSLNDPPVAATGNYVIDAGDSLTLNASATVDPDVPLGDVLSYAWDLNGDGVYETLTGNSAVSTLTWAQLLSAGIAAPATYNASLRVTDLANAVSTRAFTLQTLTVDYGDALNTYGTLKGSDGAAHVIQGGLFLGASVDSEFDGQPISPTNPAGDGSDEDGVEFTSLLETTPIRALDITMTVTASATGKLDAWLDLNQDGVFQASEHVNGGVSYSVVAGANPLSFQMLPNSPTGTTRMRFRVSSTGGLLPTGRVTGGEVEDYVVPIRQVPTPETPDITKPVDSTPFDSIPPQTSDTTPLIEWETLPENHHYTVVIKTFPAGTVVFTQSNVTTNQLEVTPALPAGEYVACVTAFNRIDQEAATAEYRFVVAGIVVSSPAGDIVTHRPEVRWTEVAGSKSYTVEVRSVRTGNVVDSATLNVSAGFVPRYTVPFDLSLGSYVVRVQSTDAADFKGDWSPDRTFAVRTPTTVTAPTGVLQNLKPTVTWTPIFSAVTYELTLTNITDGQVAYQIADLTSTNWTPPQNLKMAEYSVTVRGFNSFGDSSLPSAQRTFTIQPSVVAVAPIGRVGTSTPTFSWSLVEGAETYELIINRGWGDLGVAFSQRFPATSSFTIPTPLPLGNYTYKFRAINVPEAGSMVTEVSTAFSPNTQLVVATAPVVTAPATITASNNPEIRWTNPLGSQRSDIWVAQNGGDPQFLRVNGVTGTSYIPNQKAFGIGIYTVWVRTYSDTDNPATTADERVASNWSIGRQIRVNTPPVIVAPAANALVTDSKPSLSWNAVPGAVTYEVWIDNDSTPMTQIYRVPAIGSVSHKVLADLPIGRYTFWVRGTNGRVEHSAWSNPVKFAVTAAPVLTGPVASSFNNKPRFTWTSPTQTLNGVTAKPSSFQLLLERFNATTNQFVPLPTIANLQGNSYTLATALQAGSYRASVRGITNGRSALIPETVSAFSNTTLFTIDAPPVVAAIPTSGNRTPTINWTATPGNSRFEVFISTQSNPNVSLIRQIVASGSSFNVTIPLTAGGYRVWVRAISTVDGSVSAWSAPMNFTVTAVNDSALPLDSLTGYKFTILPAVDPGINAAKLRGSEDDTVTIGDSSPVSDFSSSSHHQPIAAEALDHAMAAASVVPGDAAARSLDLTDDILAGWDQQSWWDGQVTNEVKFAQPESTPIADATAARIGLFGAMMTLIPKTFRRKRGE